MNNPLASAEAYELFLYTLSERFPSIRRSTLAFTRRGFTLAVVPGELVFDDAYRIVVRERIIYNRLPLTIDGYGYEIWHGDQRISWYDPQPHLDDPSLQATFPHHKHVPPNMKHHRIPAEKMSFARPNVPVLIEEVEKLIEGCGASPDQA